MTDDPDDPLTPGAVNDRVYVNPEWWILTGRITTRRLLQEFDDYTHRDLADDINLALALLQDYLEGSRVPTLERAQAIESSLDEHLWEYQSVYDADLEEISLPYRDIDGNLVASE